MICSPQDLQVRRSRRSIRAFTMVEIVLSLAVIAVAMVALIGVLPLGMNVEAENRETSIVNADASIWMEALRGGAQEIGYFTNFIQEVRLDVTRRAYSDLSVISQTSEFFDRYDFHSASNFFTMINQPKYRYVDRTGNGDIDERIDRDVYIDFRAMNGNMADLTADDDFAFKYRVHPELIPKASFTTNLYQQLMETNLYELRLQFGWPLVIGPGGDYRAQTDFTRALTFRTLVSGTVVAYTNEFDPTELLYFVNPRQFDFNPPRPQP